MAKYQREEVNVSFPQKAFADTFAILKSGKLFLRSQIFCEHISSLRYFAFQQLGSKDTHGSPRMAPWSLELVTSLHWPTDDRANSSLGSLDPLWLLDLAPHSLLAIVAWFPSPSEAPHLQAPAIGHTPKEVSSSFTDFLLRQMYFHTLFASCLAEFPRPTHPAFIV